MDEVAVTNCVQPHHELFRPHVMNIAKRWGMAMLMVTLTVWVVAGCENGGETDPSTRPDVTSSTSPAPTIQLGPREEASLYLYVSNQSFADDPVDVTISIDGIEIVDQPFIVENQHTWILFPVNASRGKHTLSAVSDTGAELEQTFTLPTQGRRYAVLDYWSQGRAGRHFTWEIQNRPVAFG